MKKVVLTVTILMISLLSVSVFSQNDPEPEALGLPGDNLNLYAVLDVFQKSKTLEDFERAINDKSNNINNLDLNNDQNIDYIKVISQKNADSYFIILQDPINDKENQDVAVIEVSKDKKGAIAVQIIGDEALYGKDYIVEPSGESATGTPNPGYTGDKTVIVNNTTNNYNNGGYETVSSWPMVVYLYSPVYYNYQSPFYWGFYPSYWNPWAPVFYYNYWGYHNHFYRNHYYHRTGVIRNSGYYYNYSNRRTSSSVVLTNTRNGAYRATYNGREFKRPEASTRTTSPTRNSNSNPTRSNTRATVPSTPRATTTPRSNASPRATSSPVTPRSNSATPRANPSTPRSNSSPVTPRSNMPRATSSPAPQRSSMPATRASNPSRSGQQGGQQSGGQRGRR